MLKQHIYIYILGVDTGIIFIRIYIYIFEIFKGFVKLIAHASTPLHRAGVAVDPILSPSTFECIVIIFPKDYIATVVFVLHKITL